MLSPIVSVQLTGMSYVNRTLKKNYINKFTIVNKMETPQELEVWYLLPAIRREFTRLMLGHGLKKTEIARIMSISKPAVSMYISSKRGSDVVFNKRLTAEIKRSVKNLVMKKTNAMLELQKICGMARKERLVCTIHRSRDITLKNCEVCYNEGLSR